MSRGPNAQGSLFTKAGHVRSHSEFLILHDTFSRGDKPYWLRCKKRIGRIKYSNLQDSKC